MNSNAGGKYQCVSKCAKIRNNTFQPRKKGTRFCVHFPPSKTYAFFLTTWSMKIIGVRVTVLLVVLKPFCKKVVFESLLNEGPKFQKPWWRPQKNSQQLRRHLRLSNLLRAFTIFGRIKFFEKIQHCLSKRYVLANLTWPNTGGNTTGENKSELRALIRPSGLYLVLWSYVTAQMQRIYNTAETHNTSQEFTH